MNREQEILTISKLVFELTLLGNKNNDLDAILGQLFCVLSRFPSLGVQQRGAILLMTPRHELVAVAQHGLEPDWSPVEGHPALQALELNEQTGSHVQSLAGGQGLACILPLRDGERLLGLAALFLTPEFHADALHLSFMDDLARALSSLVMRNLTSETLLVREMELEEARTDAIRRLGVASEYRDNETGWHVMRMTHYASAIGKQMGLSEAMRELLTIAAPMHDVGKIGISDSILLKPGKLTIDEFEVMKRHAEIGERILEGEDPLISTARTIAATHHERWDGTGYPRGLKGEAIPILGRICAIADVFDALTSSRPYKQAWPTEQAIDLIHRESGGQFDPAAVEAFDRALPDILRIKELYRDEVIDPAQILTLPDLPQRSEAWVRWDDSLTVGIDGIDAHHRYLFDLTNDLYDVVVRKLGAREVARVLKALDTYAQIHFRAEEKMMQHFGYTRLGEQQHQHHAFEEKLREFYDELHINPLTAQFDVLTYLRRWLISHIRHEDAQLLALTGCAL